MASISTTPDLVTFVSYFDRLDIDDKIIFIDELLIDMTDDELIQKFGEIKKKLEQMQKRRDNPDIE